MNMNNNKPNFDRNEVLNSVFRYQRNFLRNKLSNFFNNLDDSLFNLAEKSHTNKEQSRYFDSLRLVRVNRTIIKKCFFEGIENQYKTYQQGNLVLNKLESEIKPTNTLSLIDNSELDKKLVIDDLIKKSETKYLKQLFCINKRMSVLMDYENDETNLNPLLPCVLVELFSKSIDTIELHNNVVVIIYKLFERNVMDQLNYLYSQINQQLISQNILPNIDYNVNNKESDSKTVRVEENKSIENDNTTLSMRGSNEQPSNIDNIQSSNTEISNQQNLDNNFQLILDLLKVGHKTLQISNSKNNSEYLNLPSLSLGIMIDMMSLLQYNVFKNTQINERVIQSPIEIKDDLIGQLQQEVDSISDKTMVKPIDVDIIDLVGLLFQYIVDDRNLPTEMQLLLVKLQIPYMKIALKNRKIFSNKKHEARVLLDSMALACVGWSEEADWNNKFRNKIEEITFNVLVSEDFDRQFFIDLQENFDAFMVQLKKKSDVTQRRTQETTTGEEKIDKARKDSAQLLVDAMSNHNMPKFVRDILLGEWSSVLVLMFLRHKIDEKIFEEKVEFVQQVIDYSQIEKNKTITMYQIQQLLTVYKKGLNLVAFNPTEINNKCMLLSQCLTDIHAITPTESDYSQNLTILNANNLFNLEEMRDRKNEITGFIEKIIDPISEKNVDNPQIDDRYIKQVESLSEGSWLEFSRFPKARIRAKLSWISEITDDYVFINSRGAKVLTATKADLAYRFKMRKIRLLDQEAIFDRALSTIALRLKVANFKNK